mmetsp:Transcript_8829/g.8371  ORF Transcript_8829/g.8371 Transcript_8829/m.8371 type:complete len:266 (+) Transcript_8829:290-1087(+)
MSHEELSMLEKSSKASLNEDKTPGNYSYDYGHNRNISKLRKGSDKSQSSFSGIIEENEPSSRNNNSKVKRDPYGEDSSEEANKKRNKGTIKLRPENSLEGAMKEYYSDKKNPHEGNMSEHGDSKAYNLELRDDRSDSVESSVSELNTKGKSNFFQEVYKANLIKVLRTYLEVLVEDGVYYCDPESCQIATINNNAEENDCNTSRNSKSSNFCYSFRYSANQSSKDYCPVMDDAESYLKRKIKEQVSMKDFSDFYHGTSITTGIIN